MTSNEIDWVLFKSLPSPRMRLVCFPCAGGTPLEFRGWAEPLARHGIEVESVRLPGRETRIRQEPFRSLPALIDAILPHFVRPAACPFAFFGHSMGALIAYELARSLHATTGPGVPAKLIVASRIAPQTQSRKSRLYLLPDEEFMERVRGYEGSPENAVTNAALMRLLLPTLRADFELVETYDYEPGRGLSCEVHAFGGTDDRFTPAPALEAWSELTTGRFSVSYLPGGHFFLRTCREKLVQRLRDVLVPSERSGDTRCDGSALGRG